VEDALTGDEYLRALLQRESVDTSYLSPALAVRATLEPHLRQWGGVFIAEIKPSGSFAKGTAVRHGTDIDLFVSLAQNTQETLKEIYDKLCEKMRECGYTPKRQNVSIGVKVGNFEVDLVPGKRQQAYGSDHSLWRQRANTWTKTNVDTHIHTVVSSGRRDEIKILKLWRNQNRLDFPSFYLELSVIRALNEIPGIGLAANVWNVFTYLRDRFTQARIVDPANTANIISDDLTSAQRTSVAQAAARALQATTWGDIVR
jgi:Second Messenger Oligonucleotide or Dinucleotide Synthetase domain